MLREWTLSQLELVKDASHVLVRDPLRLLPEADGKIHAFARDNGYTVIVAATNLVFRDLYERATSDPEVKKLLVIDRAPARRRAQPSVTKAPPPFYPDLLEKIPEEARIELDLRRCLMEKTGDPLWPRETNDPRYGRLIARNLDEVLRAHRNLRIAHPGRFTDDDFQRIVAYSSLGVAERAFKILEPPDYWKIGLLSHEVLEELENLTPEITRTIKNELRKAPAPFCFFVDHDAEMVIKAFYLSLIFSQHTEQWQLPIANLDPALILLTNINTNILKESAPKLIAFDLKQVQRDIEFVEKSLHRDFLQHLLLNEWRLDQASVAARVIETERYSTLIRSLALLCALSNLVSSQSADQEQKKIQQVLFTDVTAKDSPFVNRCQSLSWSHLREAYRLICYILPLRAALNEGLKELSVLKPDKMTFASFRNLWNDKQVNRLEYYLSALERLLSSGDFLPRPAEELPEFFVQALQQIRSQIRIIASDIFNKLDDLNRRFQAMIAVQYPLWLTGDGEAYLTSHFLRRALKPNWDLKTEKAVVFIFDGMRYDIWDELLRPLFEERMEIIADYPATSLLPSETHITRKAISAGAFPDEFDLKAGEDKLLKNALARLFDFKDSVEVINPDGTATGETVHYRTTNLDVYIFELCDKELHKIPVKTLPDGRQVPARPLSFIYQQHIKNIIDTELMAVIRTLKPGTKVFITADHGFGLSGREALWFDERDLNEKSDCAYTNCLLRVSFADANIPEKVRSNVIAFAPDVLRMPKSETRVMQKTGQVFHKEYKTIAFPKVGYSFSRQGSPYHPDAYTHGGISIQEMMIPMIALRVKPLDEGMLQVEKIMGPAEAIEGEETTFRLAIRTSPHAPKKTDLLRVDLEAAIASATVKRASEEANEEVALSGAEQRTLPSQVLYVPTKGEEVIIRYKPEPHEATIEERRQGIMERILTVTLSYREHHRNAKKVLVHRFTVRLNSEQVIRRIPAHLGNILGLTPRKMR